MKIKLTIFVILIVLGVNAQQQFTLNDAIEFAKFHNPRLQSANLEIEKNRTAKREAWDPGPTSVSYTRGQLIGLSKNDYELAITQSIGSGFTQYYQNTLINKQLSTASNYRILVEREVTAEVKRAWVYYLYTLNLVRMYKEQKVYADQLQKYAELYYLQGEINKMEFNMTTTQAASMYNKVFQAEVDHQLATKRLQWVCFSDTPIIPTDTLSVKSDILYNIPITSDAFNNYYKSIMDEYKAKVSVEKSKYFPNFSLTYIKLTMLPEDNLSALGIGVTIPLFFFAQESRVKQAKINFKIAQQEFRNNTWILNNKVEELKFELHRHEETLRFFTESALPEAQSLMESAKILLKNNESNINDFVQSMNAALEIRRGYEEAIYSYNVAALEFELYK